MRFSQDLEVIAELSEYFIFLCKENTNLYLFDKRCVFTLSEGY